ncbi:MAG TPA: ribonuclease III [Candidatus Ornithomonoglobus merdipullorum]|uniref:Ribonuclease 3 n=1 Tax=Candidatus Ornithomonoglobus merdipullorum TaxID=2840895 RepID=A0A9D1MB98_9FIRM|nr:ribonuclease III [Candidatus Ornithomonoglobus merdipullorum]
MTEAEKKIGYKFKNEGLLKIALTHSSYANENHTRDNERLEFLGDSVLSIIISDYIFKRMQDVDEGDLTKFRATLVCEQSLASVAEKIHLNELVFLGRGEERTGGRRRPSIISDAFEAVLAAIYLDSGIEKAREWLLGLMTDRIEKVLAGEYYSDYKTTLQEIVQKNGKGIVSYVTVSETGKEHNKQFTVKVVINGEPKHTGVGHSKKEAEQAAAKAALAELKDAKKI